MKTKKQNQPIKQTNPVEIPSKQEAKSLFIKSLGKAVDGANNPRVKDFLFASDILIENERPFTVHDLLLLTKGTDIKTSELISLFESWTAKMVALGRIRKIESIYDNNLFLSV